MKVKRIEHIAIAAPSLAKSVALFRDAFGIEMEYEETIGSIRLAMLPVGEANAGQTYIELLEGEAEGDPVRQRIAERGPGLWHICLEVDDIDGALAELKARGVKLRDESPKPGHGGSRIAFLDPASTGDVLIELAQLPAGH